MRKTLVLTALILTGVCAFTGNIGTKSAQAKTASYKMNVIQTAYCLQGTMANGHYVHYGAVATDTSVIPMGTRMYIPGYGYGRAEDTGKAVRGRHIDVWVSSCSAAMHMTKYVTITILR